MKADRQLRRLMGSLLVLCVLLFGGCREVLGSPPSGAPSGNSMKAEDSFDEAVLGGGCFWCIEAIFQSIIGVQTVEPGYAGGNTPNPTYEEISTGETGHAEVARIRFDLKQISYAEILEIFFHAHDPTTLNRQGNDVGTQYRSIVLYNSESQKEEALRTIKKIQQSGLWKSGREASKIATEIKSLDRFFPAEDYHKNYYKNHSSQPYCSIVIAPKLQKIYKEFAGRIKAGSKSAK